jgi:phosphoglycerate dehydrogenase-like enzyme
MRVLIHLANPVPAFQPTPGQLAALATSAVPHEIVIAEEEGDFLAALPSADAVVVWRFEASWYARAARLAHVFTPAAGREGFAPDPAARVVRHFGRFHGTIMAESLVAMIAFMNRRMGAALAAQSVGRWDRAPYSECRRLRGQLALIIGFGSIGRECGRLLTALGMRVEGLRRSSLPSAPDIRTWSAERRLEALAGADHVVCVLPGDTNTEHFLDAVAFAHMKRSAFVYNLGRGNAIDPEALRQALCAGRIAGAFLDVVPEEPLPAGSELWTTPNLYLWPHSSAISAEYLDLYFEQLARELAVLAPAAPPAR